MFVIGVAVGATIAYGTGYYYPPYVYWGPGVPYPVYRPWPGTYGVGAVYNPRTGGWAAGRTAYGPYGAVGSSAWYNPATGRYGRSATVQGPYGGRTVASSYNPWTGRYGATSQGHNAYAQWGHSVASNGNEWVRQGHVTTARGTVSGYQTSTGQRGVVQQGTYGTVARGSNGTYAGRDGNIYRENSNGSWSQYNNSSGSWNQVNTTQAQQQARQQAQQNLQNRQQIQQNPQNARPASSQSLGSAQHAGQSQVSQSTLQNLNNSAAARQRGQAQTQRFQSYGGGARASGGGRLRR